MTRERVPVPAAPCPGSAKDSGLLLTVPHLVLDGERIAWRSGARHSWFHPGWPPLQPQLERHRSTPCAQLHEDGVTSSTSQVGGCSRSHAPMLVTSTLSDRNSRAAQASAISPNCW